MERIIERLQNEEKARETPGCIISKGIFLSNVFSGSSLLSSFEMARGYSPSLYASGSRGIDPKLLKTNIQQTTIRALQRILGYRIPNTLTKAAIKSGDRVFYYFKSTKKNEPIYWRTGVVSKVHYVL